MARFASCIEFATGEVKGAETTTSIADGGDFTMTGSIIVAKHTIMPTTDNLTVFDDDCAERTTVILVYAFACLSNCELHKIVRFHSN